MLVESNISFKSSLKVLKMDFKNEIIVDNERIDIVINKKGENVSLNLSERGVENSLMDLIGEFGKYVRDKSDSEPNRQSEDKFFAFCESKIEEAFGRGSIRRIFGVDHPNGNMLLYFVMKLSKIIEKFKSKSTDNLFEKLEKEFGSKYIKKSQNKSV